MSRSQLHVSQSQDLQQREQRLAELKTVVTDLLAEAKQLGATDCEANISYSQGFSVAVRLGELETIEHNRDQGLGVTVYFGKKKGNASTSDLTPAAVKETVAAACAIAHYATEDEYSGLPEKEMLASQLIDLDLCHPWQIEPEQATEIALECETNALQYDAEITNSEGASLNTHWGLQVMANSYGFLDGYWTSRHSISSSVIGERDGAMQRDYWYTVARDQADLDSAAAVGKETARRTLRRLGARSLSTRQCPVLFVPEVARGLLGNFIAAISGGNLYRKSTFLLDSVDQHVFPEFIRLHEQPHLTKALGSAPCDGEGVVTKARDIVTDGIVQGYVLGSYSARKLNLKTTGNAGGTHNLTLEPGDQNFADLLKTMNTGLILLEVIGQGVNLITGDYSRGAAGLWVENGEIAYAVEEITIAGNLRDMFANIIAVGNDVDESSGTRTGSILIDNMTVAGN